MKKDHRLKEQTIKEVEGMLPLKESEQIFRTIFENASEGILLVDTESKKILMGNKQIYKDLGYGPVEIKTLGVMDIHPEKDLPHILDQFEKLIRGEIRVSRDIPVKRKDGSFYYAEISTLSIPLIGKTLTIGIFRDVTDRKQAEEALHKSEAKYRLLTEEMNDIIGMMDLNMKIIYVSPSIKKIAGFTPEECMRLDPTEMMTPESLARVVDVMSEELEREQIEGVDPQRTAKMELEYYHKNGSTIWMETVASFIRDDSGRVIGIHGVSRDITDRRRAESALRESEKRFHSLIQKSSDIIVILDAKGVMTYETPSLESILGYQPGYLIGKSPFELIHPADLKRVTDDLNEVYLRTNSGTSTEFRFRKADGTWIYLEANEQNFLEDPAINGIVITARDITERKCVEEERIKLLAELERSNKDLEQFADVAAHDLQEPLRIVSSFTQLLASRYGDKLDEKARNYMEFAVKGSNRMQRMIQGLLNYSHIVTQMRAPDLADMNSVIDETLANLHLAISDSGASVTHDALPIVMADHSQLIQVFQNLIGNAIKFRREDPLCIHISADKLEDEWIFSVKDNGIGIEPQHFERIFVLFERLHAGEKYQGNGIGLAFCKRIIARLGGRIWVESKPGKGSTFYFTLKGGVI